jgi:hypothetical protein
MVGGKARRSDVTDQQALLAMDMARNAVAAMTFAGMGQNDSR